MDRKLHIDLLYQHISIVINCNIIDKELRKIYTKGKNVDGRDVYSPTLLFKMLLIGQWEGLSDVEVEKRVKLYFPAMSFCGLTMEDGVPDHSTLSRFWKLLIDKKCMERILRPFNKQLEEHKVLSKSGVHVDATLTQSLLPKHQKINDKKRLWAILKSSLKSIFIFVAMMCLFSNELMSLNIDIAELSIDKSFDSIDDAINISLKKGDKVTAMRLMTNKGRLLLNRGLYSSLLMVLNNAIELSENGRDTLEHAEIKTLYMECLNIKCGAYGYMSRYEDAINCCIQMDKYNRDDNPLYKTKFYNMMGVIFSMNGKLEQAKEYYKRALSVVQYISNEDEKREQLFSIYGNLGGIFALKSDFDSAQIYLMAAHKLAILMKDTNKELNWLQFLGEINRSTGKYELAISYYKEAFTLAKKCNNYYLLPIIKLNISICYIDTKEYKLAFSSALEALEMSRLSDFKNVEIKSLLNISLIYKRMGNYRKSLYYLEKSNRIRDSIFNQDNEERFLRQKTDFETYKMSVESKKYNSTVELERKKRAFNNTITYIILILLLTLIFLLTRKLIQQNRRHKTLIKKCDDDRQNFVKEKIILEKELYNKSYEISLNEVSMVKRKEHSLMIMSRLKILRTNFQFKSKGLETVKEIEDLVIKISNDNLNDDAKYYLDQITTDFYDKLDILHPELTLGEKRICALMSLKLSSKDIVNITGKSRGAIDNFKFRIKKKINANSEADLGDYFFRMRS